MSKYSIGIDYGTLSGRAVIVDVATGNELASAVYDYPHGVMDSKLPNGINLPIDWALEHPQDYLDVLAIALPQAVEKAGINTEDIIGIGIDFTASTPLPVKSDGTPLCFIDEFKDNPHAYVKLWKHHAAQDKANLLNEVAAARGEDWLQQIGRASCRERV